MVRQTSELPAQRRCEVLLLDTNGYTAGLDTKIPVGRIVCDSTFDSYSLHGVNGEDWGQGENPVFSTQVLSRTVGGPLRYRMPQTAERRRALPAANATTARKEEPSAKSTARGAAASKKITAKKFAIPPQICSTPPGRVDVAKIHSMPPRSCPMPPESSRLIPEFCNDTQNPHRLP